MTCNENKSAVDKWNEYSLAHEIVLIKDRLDDCVSELKHLPYDAQAYEHGMKDEELERQLKSTVAKLKEAIKSVDSLIWLTNEWEQEVEYVLRN